MDQHFNNFVSFRTDDLKIGELVGEDKYGNRYFQNNAFFVGNIKIISYAKNELGLAEVKRLFFNKML